MPLPSHPLARAGALLALLAAGDPRPAATGGTYLPLVAGNRWTYAVEGGGTEVQVVDRELTVLARPAFAVVHRVDGVLVQEDYWSAAGGDVFFHGIYRPIEDFGRFYEPPLRAVDAPLAPGATWASTAEVFILPDTSSIGMATFSFAARSEGDIAVPAGTFHAFEIEEDSGALPRRWVALDLGTVRFDDGGSTRSLASYSVVLPVAPVSWGRLKWKWSRQEWSGGRLHVRP